jgi:hypothetical protein
MEIRAGTDFVPVQQRRSDSSGNRQFGFPFVRPESWRKNRSFEGIAMELETFNPIDPS